MKARGWKEKGRGAGLHKLFQLLAGSIEKSIPESQEVLIKSLLLALVLAKKISSKNEAKNNRTEA